MYTVDVYDGEDPAFNMNDWVNDEDPTPEGAGRHRFSTPVAEDEPPNAAHISDTTLALASPDEAANAGVQTVAPVLGEEQNGETAVDIPTQGMSVEEAAAAHPAAVRSARQEQQSWANGTDTQLETSVADDHAALALEPWGSALGELPSFTDDDHGLFDRLLTNTDLGSADRSLVPTPPAPTIPAPVVPAPTPQAPANPAPMRTGLVYPGMASQVAGFPANVAINPQVGAFGYGQSRNVPLPYGAGPRFCPFTGQPLNGPAQGMGVQSRPWQQGTQFPAVQQGPRGLIGPRTQGHGRTGMGYTGFQAPAMYTPVTQPAPVPAARQNVEPLMAGEEKLPEGNVPNGTLTMSKDGYANLTVTEVNWSREDDMWAGCPVLDGAKLRIIVGGCELMMNMIYNDAPAVDMLCRRICQSLQNAAFWNVTDLVLDFAPVAYPKKLRDTWCRLLKKRRCLPIFENVLISADLKTQYSYVCVRGKLESATTSPARERRLTGKWKAL
ncbi:hypothetical protein EJ05DRAFT_514021 [Pseudovirgaria hyperparasitica]|uniref:Uncharacterized protein n=1 Tax=Pseudovirgaria hyperparasitica TaxID=470096 RepID=A0A6A6VZ18_9PEZI|nr:uncharacterized protein EJ05DRAFT_514021 [Pseudovirgaria hyperparasitica]KAF2754557.1 hypothetical protein EJ05DRAFT_514021 [Pseudovirgaria hyperparasitica]